MRSRRRLTAPAFVALAGMLFLQAAIAFAACELPERSATMLHAMTQPDSQSDCHEPAQDQALCIAHCGAQDQTAAKAQFDLPDLAAHPATPIRMAAQHPLLVVRDRAAPGAAAGPPARILFQSFLL